MTMEKITLNYARTLSFIDQACIDALSGDVELHHRALWEKTGKGNDFLGWVHLPGAIADADLKQMDETGQLLRDKKIDLLVVIGIGGSYLGAKAVIDALSDSFAAMKPSRLPWCFLPDRISARTTSLSCAGCSRERIMP